MEIKAFTISLGKFLETKNISYITSAPLSAAKKEGFFIHLVLKAHYDKK